MAQNGIFFFFFLALMAMATTLSQLQAAQHSLTHEIHSLRPHSGSSGENNVSGLSCASWKLAVEANNLIGWKTVPYECAMYVGHYMLGHQYRSDSRIVVEAAIAYAKNATLKGDGKDIWVFDIDETLLSNLPFYAANGFGVNPFNQTLFSEWEEKGIAPALPESLRLYNTLLTLGFKVVFLTGKAEGDNKRKLVVSNLITAGFHNNWEKLILKRSEKYTGKTSVVYKTSERKQLEADGYRIVGNIGDQWSDILGAPQGLRTFKLPDPMYYIS